MMEPIAKPATNNRNELVAIYFIWKRELIRFLRSKSRVIGSLALPFFMLAILGTGLNSVMSGLSNMRGGYLGFITPGILSMVLLTGSILSGVQVIMDRQFGFLKETLVAPVKRTSIVIGKALGGATTAVIQGVLMLFIALIFGSKMNLANLPLVILLMCLVSFTLVSLGIAIASLMEDMHGFQLIINFLIMPMFFLSGALFPLDSAPKIVQYASFIDPLTYAVEAFRFFMIGSSTMNIFVSVGVLATFAVLTTFSAAYLFNRIES